jgi:glucosamine-6-phosphate deaminase
MKLIIKNNYDGLCKETANIVIGQIRKKPSSSIMLPSGETAKKMYSILVSAYKKKKVSFKKVKFFQLDDILGAEKKESYSTYLRERFIDKVNIQEKNVFLFDSLSKTPKEDCVNFEKEVRKKGIDLCVLGLGANAHIAFNEPGSKATTKTRIAILDKNTQKVKSSKKTKAKKVFTIGMSTIMISKKIIVMANGEKKSRAIKAIIKNENYLKWPASILNKHKNVTLVVDKKVVSLF